MSLLHLKEDYRWEITGIEFAIKERVGEPLDFIGRVEEMEYLYQWASNIRRGISRSIAFLGRRKTGKSLMLERLYNILYSEHNGLIPFYYEFREGERSSKEFYQDFVVRFYMQLAGYYTRDIRWIRDAVARKTDVNFDALIQRIGALNIPHKPLILDQLITCRGMFEADRALYEYVLSATAMPDAFAVMPEVEERIVQMIDEFQYLNMYIDAGVEEKPCKTYMSTAESRVAPLLITGSLMGVVAEELMRWLPSRFGNMLVPKMKAEESRAMTLNYGIMHGHSMTPEIAEYMVYVTNGIPGRIVELVTPRVGKPMIHALEDVDHALEFEVDDGMIKRDWDDYLVLAMDEVNSVNMRKMTYFLCQHEGTWYTTKELKDAMSLQLSEQTIRNELELLYKYDIIEKFRGRYGGVFDRTLKKVLMSNYRDILDLAPEEFDAYFKSDSLLDYLKERIEQLELGLAENRRIRHSLDVLRGQHNNLKGRYYELEVLLHLLKNIIDRAGGLVEGIRAGGFAENLNYHLKTGEEIDIVLEGDSMVVMVECKNYASDNIDQITPMMVDEFVEKARRLHTARFPEKELRLGFFSKHGFEQQMENFLTQHGIVRTW